MNSIDLPFTYTPPAHHDPSTSYPDDSLLCTICTEPLVNPKRTNPCNHIFCHLCISTWLQQSITCPMDRTPISGNLMMPDEEFLKRLDELVIRCQCGYEGARSGHLDFDGMVGCMVKCEVCEKAVKRLEYEDHFSPCRSTLDIQQWFPTLRFGMSPTEVTRLIFQQPNNYIYRSFQDLPVANEVTNFECRYIWYPTNQLEHLLSPTLLQLFSQEVYEYEYDDPYLCFLFHEVNGLCMISLRSMDQNTFLDAFMDLFGIEPINEEERIEGDEETVARNVDRKGCIVWLGNCVWDVGLANVEFVDPRCVARNGHAYVLEED
ncbi:E3 ubiquitin-protein ligase NRDP1 [Blyttiomyces sp. JEL0837]|nr:E3 ubiquitin-protein ligase NRDP1 [Blyttiomyces sp. JEL0837]